MCYQKIQPISREEAQEKFTEGDPFTIAETLVCLAFHDPDGWWVEQHCFRFIRDPDPGIRAIAAVCLGHLARIHGTLTLDIALPLLEELRRDPMTASQAEDALGDINMFIARKKREK